MLRCDADKFQRVFDNLLRNAVIYSFENTDITISAQCQEDTVSIIFCNHGDTLPEEKLNRIFEQFYRLDGNRQIMMRSDIKLPQPFASWSNSL